MMKFRERKHMGIFGTEKAKCKLCTLPFLVAMTVCKSAERLNFHKQVQASGYPYAVIFFCFVFQVSPRRVFSPFLALSCVRAALCPALSAALYTRRELLFLIFLFCADYRLVCHLQHSIKPYPRSYVCMYTIAISFVSTSTFA